MVTENYIKQCEQAEEIQKLCEKVTGDCIYLKNSKEINIIGIDEFYWLENFGSGKPAKEWVKSYWEGDRPRYYGNKGIWLPTQEQLQKMMRPKLDPITLIYLIDRFVASGEGYWHSFAKAPYPDPSMNELWLAFVMKEKYNKTWNGEKWIKLNR